jgi:ribulose-5-phosphate 4-epimerase/fuculose-1-phosphate aldolase
LRIPGPEHHFLINPYGLMFDEITASSLVKIDLNGNAVIDTPYEVNPAGFTIHSAIHSAEKMRNVFFIFILMTVLRYLFKKMACYQ